MADRKSTKGVGDDADQIITNQDQVALQEAENGLLQFDEVRRLAEQAIPALHFTADPEMILSLNRIAIQGIRHSAGSFRTIPISITNTSHVPPPPADVSGFVRELCDYVNASWFAKDNEIADALHIAAYIMWRLNWIHPFRDGNGRTSRAVAYLALCTRLGHLLIGTPTVADQIVDNRQPYYRALDAADTAWKAGQIDVSIMEALLRDLLLKQLASS